MATWYNETCLFLTSSFNGPMNSIFSTTWRLINIGPYKQIKGKPPTLTYLYSLVRLHFISRTTVFSVTNKDTMYFPQILFKFLYHNNR